IGLRPRSHTHRQKHCGCKQTDATSFAHVLPSCGLLHNNLAMHPGFIVASNETGELELTGLGKSPKEFTTLPHSKTLSIWVIMLHIGKPFHEFCMFAVFSDGRQHELVAFSPGVFQNETDLLAFPHGDHGRFKLHVRLTAVVDHCHTYGSCRFLGITRLASGENHMIFMCLNGSLS